MQNIILSENVPLVIDIEILRSHLRIANNHEDEYLKAIIKMATGVIENQMEISLMVKDYSFLCYPTTGNSIKLPIRNVTEITAVIQNEKPLDYERRQGTNEISFVHHLQSGFVTINYKAGISSNVQHIPDELKLAVLQIAKNLYDCSEENVLESNYIKNIVRRYHCLEL